MSDEPIYVRYVYLTPKCLELLEALEKVLPSDVALERIPKDVEVPLPPRKMRTSEKTEAET